MWPMWSLSKQLRHATSVTLDAQRVNWARDADAPYLKTTPAAKGASSPVCEEVPWPVDRTTKDGCAAQAPTR
jgi:hypothetical protein